MLRTALAGLLDRHEALRLRFAGTQQEVAPPPAQPVLASIDLSHLPAAEQATTRDAIAAAVNADFALDEGLLMRAAWFRAGGENPNQLLLAIHHLAVDGVSWRILLDDLAAALAALRAGQAMPARPAGTAWCQWARRLARAKLLPEEQRHFSALPPPAPLPRDLDAAPGMEADAASVAVRLTREQTTALLEQANRAYGTQVPELLLAAFARTLQNWTDRDEFVVDLEGHGREDLTDGMDLSRTVGWFTTLYPVHLRIEAAGPAAAIAAARKTLRAVPRGGLGFGLLHWRSPSAAPAQAEIVFNYLGQWQLAFPETSGIVSVAAGPGPIRSPRNRRAHALAVDCLVRDGVLDIELEYDGARWRHDTIHSLAEDFVRCLQAVLEHCADPARWVRSVEDFPLAQLTPAGLERLLRQPFAVEDILPATPMQQGMLFHAELADGSDLWFEQIALTLRGPLDGENFRAAWATLLRRHEVLRGSFARDERERPMLLIAAAAPLDWHTDDWSGLATVESTAAPRHCWRRSGRAALHSTGRRCCDSP